MSRMEPRPAVAWRGLALVSAAFAIALIAASGGYGYHRDELYFVAIGGHPAFGYVDQPPLVPLLAHAMDSLFAHSLVWLRLPAALAGALVVLVTGLIAREFGASGGAQLLAAGSMAVSAVLVAVSHLATTSVFDLVGWTLVSWLAVRALREDGPTWLLVGVAAGISLEVKTLPLFFYFALLVGLLSVGPRGAGRASTALVGSAIALSAAVSAVLILPTVPMASLHETPVVAINYDAGETVGWPGFAATVAGAYDALPAEQRRHAVVLGANYGEAGAVLRFRPGVPTYSGHNSFWNLGPPPAETRTAIVVGYPETDLREWFTNVQRVATIDNGVRLDNDEQGQPVWLCTDPAQSWPALWPKMQRLG
jgi:hypothetical protein